ncbi:MAG: hypothetical protein QM704_05545 [Anaeromyxobacteraceae bacterium]
MLLAPLALLALTLAPDPAVAPAVEPVDAPLTLPARPGDRGLFLLRDGRHFAGRLVVEPDGSPGIALASDAVLRVAPGAIVGRLPEPGRNGPAGAPRVLLVTKARTVEGLLLARSGGVLRIRADDGAELEVAEADLGRAEFQDRDLPLRTWADPSRIRYVHLPQPGALRRGEWTLRSSLECPLGLETAAFDWLVLSAALEAPLLYGDPVPPTGTRVDATAQLEVAGVRLAAGVTAVRSQGTSTSTLHGSAGVGGPRLHATVYAGPPVAAAARLGGFDPVVVGAAGAAWLTGRVAIVAETWWTPRRSSPAGAVAAAARLALGHLALDAGALASTDGKVVPWFAVALDGSWRVW